MQAFLLKLNFTILMPMLMLMLILMLMLMIVQQCSKEILPSQQFLVLDPGKVVIRSDHLAPPARNRGIWIFSALTPHVFSER